MIKSTTPVIFPNLFKLYKKYFLNDQVLFEHFDVIIIVFCNWQRARGVHIRYVMGCQSNRLVNYRLAFRFVRGFFVQKLCSKVAQPISGMLIAILKLCELALALATPPIVHHMMFQYPEIEAYRYISGRQQLKCGLRYLRSILMYIYFLLKKYINIYRVSCIEKSKAYHTTTQSG